MNSQRLQLLPFAVGASLLLFAACSGDSATESTGSAATESGSPAPATTSATTSATAVPTPLSALPIGTEGTTATGNSVTVYAYEQPVVSDNQSIQPDEGDEYAAIDVGGCVKTNIAAYLNAAYFKLQMPDDTPRAAIRVREPALPATNIAPGNCVRGWVSFEVPIGVKPKFIFYSSGGPSVNWTP